MVGGVIYAPLSVLGRRDALSKHNVELAASNMEKLEQVASRQRELEEYRHRVLAVSRQHPFRALDVATLACRQQYVQMHEVASADLQAYQAKQQQRTPEAIMAMLAEGAKAMEAQAESSASSVKMGQLDVRQFVSQHVDERKQYHQALILKERLQQTQKGQQGRQYGAMAGGRR